MDTRNIISTYQSIIDIKSLNINTSKIENILNLSIHEAETLAELCNILTQYQHTFDIFEGYYVGYSIKQISKEFDLLRFSDDLVINIELKSKLILNTSEKINKIKTQMEQNYYYLSSINLNVSIYTYIENDGLYKYDDKTKQANKVEFSELITDLSIQNVDYNINPDQLFVPSHYLISPFNKTLQFMEDRYFLNDTQQNIKKEIMATINNSDQKFFCISANAGTGKSLLIYDIAKTLNAKGKIPLIIHCGILNSGHSILISEFKWKIVSISSVKKSSNNDYISKDTNLIIIDEAQRIRNSQIECIIQRAITLNISIIFAYDKKQYLKEGETKDIYEYLKHNYPKINTMKNTLTNKIRTNKEIFSFITNLFDIGKSNSNLNYKDITIEYFNDLENVNEYLKYLCKCRGWTAITYTDSTYRTESISQLASICDLNAHNVIGQEFDKVVFVMDKNFWYGNDGKLQAKKTYYSIKGMMYQIVTRVVNELKIIVLDNPSLCSKLLEIKMLDKHNNY